MATIKTQIQILLMWLLRLTGCPHLRPYRFIPVSQELHDVAIFAQVLCDRLDHELDPGTSGEYKRDRVYAQLFNMYPQFRPRDLHLAILMARSNLTDPNDRLEVRGIV